jgi:type IV pilus assembly protein PilN
MIRINLLGVERQRTRKAFAFDPSQQITVACSLILVAAAVGVGWWYWSLNQQATQVAEDIASARRQTASLQTVLNAVTEFETERTQLQQRVALIRQLRSGQSIPVQLLDDVSKSVPDMLWLTSLEQKDADVTIEGRSTTLIALSDFVANLGRNPLLKKPIEILDSQVESQPAAAGGQPAADLIHFTVRAQVAALVKPPAAGRAGGAGRAGRAGAPGARR